MYANHFETKIFLRRFNKWKIIKLVIKTSVTHAELLVKRKNINNIQNVYIIVNDKKKKNVV